MQGLTLPKQLIVVVIGICHFDPCAPLLLQSSALPFITSFSPGRGRDVSGFLCNNLKGTANRNRKIIPCSLQKTSSWDQTGEDDLIRAVDQELANSRSLLASKVVTGQDVTEQLRILESLAVRLELQSSSQVALKGKLDNMTEHLRCIVYNLPVEFGTKSLEAIRPQPNPLNTTIKEPEKPGSLQTEDGAFDSADPSMIATESLKEVIFDSDIQIKEAKRLLGIANPDSDDIRYIEQVQSALKDIIKEIEDKSADFRNIVSNHALIDEAISSKNQAEDVMKLLREFQYNVPTNILRSREAQITSKQKKKRILYNLSKITNLKELVDVLSRSVQHDSIVANDLALSLNNLKRLQWQAKSLRDVEQLQQLIIKIATLISQAVDELEPRHVALSLNALASFPLSRKLSNMEERSRVGVEIPRRWRLEEDYTYKEKEFERGEVVVVQIDSKVARFGVVESEGDAPGSYVVYYQDGWDEKCARNLEVGKVGKILCEEMETLKKRLMLFSQISSALLSKEMIFACNSQDVATIIWSFAKMKTADQRVVKQLSQHLERSSLFTSMRSRDIATTLWSFSQLGYINLQLVKKLLNQFVLERNLQSAFGQDIANVLSAMAKMKLFHSKIFEALGKRAIAMSRVERMRVNAQSISSILSSLAQVNFLRTDLLLELDNLVFSLPDEPVSTQSYCNILWSHAVFRIPDAPVCAFVLRRMLKQKQRLEKSDMCQLHLFFISLSAVGEDLSTLLDGEDAEFLSECEALKEECKNVFLKTSSDVNSISDSQASLAKCARRLGRAVDEHLLEHVGYTVDIWMPELKTCLEFDGPSHFVVNFETGREQVDGSTALKTFCLHALGIRCVRVAYWEWDRVRMQGEESQIQWLKTKLGLQMR